MKNDNDDTQIIGEEAAEAEISENAASSTENQKGKEDLKSRRKETRTKRESIGRLNDMPTPPNEGEMVEGAVIEVEKSKVFVDLPPFGTGIIYGKEYINARDLIRKIVPGDKITAKIIQTENEDGYIELSLKEARKALIWKEAEEAIADKRVFELQVKDANKGGLILEWQGIQGFIPASQLGADHYPRVEDGDKEKIQGELRKLIGKKISVSVISALPRESKLIFSEKGGGKEAKEELIEKYKIGDVVSGEITGIVEFGVFLRIEEKLEGLVHISELDWGLVENPKAMFKVGEKVRAKIIEIKDDKISLSIKALKENPWREAEKKYGKGDAVSGVIIKFNKHGALASIEEGVAGLVHVSEFGGEEKLREKLELGKVYKFKIILFEPKEQKMILSPVEK